MQNNIFGVLHKKLRVEQKLSLRRYCTLSGQDTGNISKLERGIISPPQSEDTLTKMANTLSIKKNSADWNNFFQTAAISAGRLPKTIIENKELLERLPVLLRTITGQKLSDKKLDELIEIIKRH